MARRDYSGGAAATTITSAINATATTITIASATGWPDGTNGKFFVVIDRDTSSEEKVLVQSRTGTVLTVASSSDRGVDDTTATSHASGASIEHSISATDLDEANALVNLADAKGDVVVATAADTWARVAVGANDTALVADSAQTAGVKWAAVLLQALADAKGDLIVATGADTFVRIAVGSNNQVLTADSAQASGLKWATPSTETLPVTIIDAKGDLIAGTAADTAARIAVGSNGQVLVADSAQTTGVKWADATDRVSVAGFSEQDTNITTNTQLRRLRITGASSAAYAQVPVVMERAGSIIGVWVAAANARTAGTLTVEVYINGVASGLTAVLNGTDTQYAYGTQAAGADTFSAGARVDIRATSASFSTGGVTTLEAGFVAQNT